MNGERIPLTFVCVDCGRTLVVRVPKRPGIHPGRYPWQCFDCQGSWPGGNIGKGGKSCEPSKREEE